MNAATRPRPGGPYRARNGLIFGVCRGIAEHLDFSMAGLRIILIVGTLLTGLWPGIMAYIIAALLMKPEPIMPFDSSSDAEFYNSYSASSSMALQRLKDTFDNLDRRIQRMENIVTAPDFDWDERLKNNR
jgi:phage shock protein C